MRFAYINSKNTLPFDRHIIDGLRENGHTVDEILEDSPGLTKYKNLARTLRNTKVKYDTYFVGFTSPLFVPITFLFGSRKIIFNAVLSQYEANVVSRNVSPFSFQAFKWWAIDYLAFHLSWRVLLESNAQIEYIHRLFLMPRKHLIRSWSGLNEKEFFRDPAIAKQKEFTVLFRGRFLAESGIDTVIKTAKILEDSGIKFLIMGEGFLYKTVNHLMDTLHPKNIEMINQTIPIEELRRKMQQCHISLGQIANHPRLERTLPCKSFESLALGLPYLTGRNKAILELLTEDQNCLCTKPGDPEDLAKKITWAKKNPETLERIARNGYAFYKQKLTSKTLAQEIISACFH